MSALLALVLASSLDREPIKRVLQSANPAYRRCYVDALKHAAPGLEGRAQLTISVGQSGRVEDVEVSFPTEAPQFTQCLREATLKLRFLSGPAPYKLVWPVVFRGTDSKP